MPPKKHIIIIGVLCVIALGLGYVYGKWRQGSGQENAGNLEGKEETTHKEPEFLKKGLVAHYPFNGNAKDESGNGNDGEVTGATFEGDRHGMNQRACFFDGNSDFIEIKHSETVSFSSSDYTITMWLKYDSQLRYSALFIKARHGEPFKGPTVFASFIQKGKVDFREAGGSELVTNKSGFDDNVWRHFVFMKMGARYSIFIGGKLDSSVGGDFGDARININPIWIGANHGDQQTQNYKGYMDDIRIYNRALSEAEVKELYEFEKAN